MSKRIWTFSLILIVISLLLSGCYYFSSRKEIANAEKLLSQLKAAGGPTLAPYEYCRAENFLQMAKTESSEENDGKTAQALAERSRAAAEAGLAEVKKKK